MSPCPLMFEFSRPFVAFVLILVIFLQFAFKIRDVKIANFYVRESAISHGLLAFNHRPYPYHRPAYPKSVISRLVYVVISVVQAKLKPVRTSQVLEL